MKKLLIPILILPLMFFTGCSEEEETATGSDPESYTIGDMVGTWNVLSSTVAVSMSIDFSSLASIYSDLDQGTCEYLELTYDEDTGCTMDATMLAMMAAGACAEAEGSLTGNTCETSFSEDECCEEGQSETITIASDGGMTLEWVMAEGDEDCDSEVDEDCIESGLETGSISIDGTDITVILIESDCDSDDEDDCTDTINGTLHIDGDTATLEWSLGEDFDDFSDFMEDDEEDCSYAETFDECETCGGDWDGDDSYCYSGGEEMDINIDVSGSATQTIIMEKVE